MAQAARESALILIFAGTASHDPQGQPMKDNSDGCKANQDVLQPQERMRHWNRIEPHVSAVQEPEQANSEYNPSDKEIAP